MKPVGPIGTSIRFTPLRHMRNVWSFRGPFGCLLLLVIGGLLGSVPFALAQVGNRPPAISPAPGKSAASPEKRTDQQALVAVRNGRLTVQVQGRPVALAWVLDQISRQAKVAFVLSAGLEAEQVSIGFKELPLDEGLRQLLADQDAFLFYGVEKKGPASLRAVWAYPRGQGRGLAPVPPDAWASTGELEGRLGDSDPAVRAQSLEGLIERKRGQALDAVMQGLGDWDEQVRTQALYGAVNAGVTIPPETLAQVALGDPSPNVRFLALEALGGDPNAGAIAQQALNDPSPHVQLKAQEILRQLEAAARPPEPRQSVQNQPRRQGQ